MTWSLIACTWLSKENQMKDKKLLDWGAKLSIAQYTLYKTNNFSNPIGIQKSDKVPGYSTSFYQADGTWLRSLDGNGGIWGFGTIPIGGNYFEQPLPDKVRVTYLDDITNRYYQGEHSLPKDKIYDLMTSTHRKLEDENQYLETLDSNYRNIELAFAPHGWVIVFVTGWAGRQEVTSFQAAPIDPDPKTLQGEPIGSGDEILYMDYKAYSERNKLGENETFDILKEQNPQAYKKWQSGEWTISSDWYKQMQTKYPWNLSITIDGQDWNGEYYAEFANTEKFAVLDDQFDKHNKSLKAVPTKIRTWATDRDTGERTEVEVHLFPRPKWSALGTGLSSYLPYYQDPNLTLFAKNFEALYPNRSLATNDQLASPNEFALLKLDFDKDLILQAAYLLKDGQKIPLKGAYQFYRAPVDISHNRYVAKKDYPRFLTEPKIKDLSDPALVDLD